MNYISFPGLGIDEFPLNKTAFSVFGKDIVWYGVIITFGILLALLYVCYRAKKNEGVKVDDVFDFAIYLVFFGVIGARLYYVIMEFDNFKGETLGQTLMNVIAIWEGGLAIYGGIIAGGITLACVSLHKRIKLGKSFDMVAPAVMLGQLIGRWGNFFNAEAYGGETDLPWRMGIRALGETTAIYVHPTFLYESLWNLLGFILINIFYKKKKYDGQIFLMYITWYGFGRMLIEGLRTDSLYVGEFRISQVIAFLCFFFGLAILTSMEIIRRLRIKDMNKLSVATVGDGTEAAEEIDTTTVELKEAAENATGKASDVNANSVDAQDTDVNESNDDKEDELTLQDSIEELEDSESVEELKALDGASDAFEHDNSISDNETEEAFEISDSYTDDDDEE